VDGELDDLVALRAKEWVGANQQRSDMLPSQAHKGCLDCVACGRTKEPPLFVKQRLPV
jgi:hypothetical protein